MDNEHTFIKYSDDLETMYSTPDDFGWTDLGSWSSLKSNVDNDIHGNACIGQNIRVYDSSNCIIHTVSEKEVVVQGLDGYIVVEKDGILLICKLSEEQRIKLFHN